MVKTFRKGVLIQRVSCMQCYTICSYLGLGLELEWYVYWITMHSSSDLNEQTIKS